MILLFIVANLIFQSDAYSVKGRISSEGLDFLNEVGKNETMKRIHSLSIPSKSYSALGSSATIDKISITRFVMPRLNYDFGENSVILQVNGGLTLVTAEVEVEIYTLFTTTHNLDLTIQLSDISSEIEMIIDPVSDNLTLSVKDCEAEFNDVDLDFSGGFTAYVANFATKMVSPLIKQLVESQTCHMIKTIIRETINPNLADLSRRMPVGDHLPVYVEFVNVETELVRNAKLSIANNSSLSVRNGLEVSADANVIIAGSSCSAHTSPSFSDFETQNMISFWVSESVFSCFINNLYGIGQMKFEVDKTMPQAAKYLKTSCPESIAEKCIGSFFPEIAEKHANTSAVLKVSMNSAPKFEITGDDGVSVSLNPVVQIFVNSENLLELELNIDVYGIPMMEDNKIIGMFSATTRKVKIVNSHPYLMGNISSERLDQLRPALDSGINLGLKRLQKGFEFPEIMGVKVAETSDFMVEDGHVRGNINLISTNQYPQ